MCATKSLECLFARNKIAKRRKLICRKTAKLIFERIPMESWFYLYNFNSYAKIAAKLSFDFLSRRYRNDLLLFRYIPVIYVKMFCYNTFFLLGWFEWLCSSIFFSFINNIPIYIFHAHKTFVFSFSLKKIRTV